MTGHSVAVSVFERTPAGEVVSSEDWYDVGAADRGAGEPAPIQQYRVACVADKDRRRLVTVDGRDEPLAGDERISPAGRTADVDGALG